MAATLELPPPLAPSIPTKHGIHNCPACGTSIQLDTGDVVAKRKIAELEAQMEFLKEKATAAGA